MIRRAAAILLGLIVLAPALGYVYLRSSLPQVAGRLVLHGPKAEIRIARDAAGVPTITAADDDDAVFGLGFAHAQDRLAQMELMRRYGAGRLAEIIGPQAVPIDREMRTLGLYRAAAAELSYLSPALRHALDAYAAGVNAYLATRRGALPPEFLLLRFTPERWRPVDSLIWGKLMDLELAGNYRDQLLRARLSRSVSPADLAVLFPGYPADAPTTLARLRAIYRVLPLDRLLAALPPSLGPIRESNNWVVDGKHSASGKPLVANDPHLEFNAPGVWYLARLKTPQHDIAGGTAPGVPFIVTGHNERIAWGFTNTGSDVEDLFIEKIDPADPSRYVTPQGSAPFAVRHETIRVRGAAPVDIAIRATRHGPVLSDALPPGTAAPGFVLALQTPFTAADDRSAEALWNIDRAQDWNDFRAALKDFVGPQQNTVFGAADGTIGFIAPGRVPIRKNGDGWLPEPGWTGEYDWTGFIPFDRLPQATNPAAGHFVSANNRIVPSTYPYFLTQDWDLPNRFERITALLEATPRQTPQTSARIQADTLSLMAQRLVPLMTRIAPADNAQRDAIARLRRWDFHMDADKVAPLLFTAWLRAFNRAVLFGRLGNAAASYWGLRPRVMEGVLTEHPDWCDPPGHSQSQGCDRRLSAALDAALAELRRAYGGDMARWQWGRAHIAEFPGPVLGRVPVLRDWVHVAIATSGGADTIDVGSTTIRDDAHPYRQIFGAGLRIITDLADPEGARMIAVPGQSGNPFSAHFADLLRRWRDFGWLYPGRAEPAATLLLEPAR